jgi:hypothetical protein
VVAGPARVGERPEPMAPPQFCSAIKLDFDLTLSASDGSAANALSRLFTPGTGFWGVAPPA